MAYSTLRYILALFTFFLAFLTTNAQDKVVVHGAVYNMYRTKPLQAVSVQTGSGVGTTTDSNGNYYIVVPANDSIWFSYLGRTTAKYPISTVRTYNNFDIALHVDPTELKEVNVVPRNYRMDSIQNRKDYAKIFDFHKPGFKITSPTTNGGLGAGVDLDELINFFRFDRTKRIRAFQNRLIEEEQDKSVDHRFNHYIVKKITKMKDDAEIDSFMVKYRPSFEFIRHASDYDFFEYIKLAWSQYSKDRKDRP